MRAETKIDKTPKELVAEAREAMDDPERRAALVADRSRFADAVAALLQLDYLAGIQPYGDPDETLLFFAQCGKWFVKAQICVLLAAESKERGHPEFAKEWMDDAAVYEAAGEACENPPETTG
jgi:hypothetical protein